MENTKNVDIVDLLTMRLCMIEENFGYRLGSKMKQNK